VLLFLLVHQACKHLMSACPCQHMDDLFFVMNASRQHNVCKCLKSIWILCSWRNSTCSPVGLDWCCHHCYGWNSYHWWYQQGDSLNPVPQQRCTTPTTPPQHVGQHAFCSGPLAGLALVSNSRCCPHQDVPGTGWAATEQTRQWHRVPTYYTKRAQQFSRPYWCVQHSKLQATS
jgi:hypothetical protein